MGTEIIPDIESEWKKLKRAGRFMKHVGPFLPLAGAMLVALLAIALRLDPALWWDARSWTPIWYILGVGFLLFVSVSIYTLGAYTSDFVAGETAPLRARVAELELNSKNERKEVEDVQEQALQRDKELEACRMELASLRKSQKCALPGCAEFASMVGADGKNYCNGHMHKGGPHVDVVIK